MEGLRTGLVLLIIVCMMMKTTKCFSGNVRPAAVAGQFYPADRQELEADVMDYGEDTAPAESIADDLQQRLDHFQALEETFEVSVYRERRQPLQEND